MHRTRHRHAGGLARAVVTHAHAHSRAAGVHGEPLELCHDVAREEDGALVLLVEGRAAVDGLEDVHVRGVDGGAVRVAEEGDELVAEDVHIRGHQRGGHAAVCGGVVGHLDETDVAIDFGEREGGFWCARTRRELW